MNWKKSIKKHLFETDRITYLKEDQERNKDYLDCSLGINPFGSPEGVTEIIKEASNEEVDISKYPSPYHKELKQAISDQLMKTMDVDLHNQVRIATGSMSVLQNMNKMIIDSSKKVLGISPQFIEYVTEVKVSGGKYNSLKLKPENQFRFQTKEFLKKMADEKPDLIYILIIQITQLDN